MLNTYLSTVAIAAVMVVFADALIPSPMDRSLRVAKEVTRVNLGRRIQTCHATKSDETTYTTEQVMHDYAE